jgi:hypothetical protein
VRSHAKAASAGSTEGSGRSRGLFRRALVIRGASGDAKGTGARSRRSPLALAVTLVASVALLVGVEAPAANAAAAIPSYGYLASFGGTAFSTTNQFNAVAVDENTGDIFVAPMFDQGNGGKTDIKVFSPDPTVGGVPLTTVEVGGGKIVVAVAIDQSDGSLYAYDLASMRVYKYVSDGAAVPTYTLDPSFDSPSLGNQPAGLAVDSGTHDVLFANYGGAGTYVSRLDPTGAELSSFDGSDTADGVMQAPGALAVGPGGTTYVVEQPGTPHPRVEQFDASGASLGRVPIATGGVAFAIATNSQSGEVAVVVSVNGETFIEGFTSARQPTFSVPLPPQASGEPAGLAWDAAANRIYLDTRSGTVHTFVPATQPGVDSPVVSDITPTTIHVETEVDPGTPLPAGSGVHFEYKPAGGSTWESTPDQLLSGPETKEADISGLEPNLDYLVRAKASNSLTSHISAPTPFRTAPIPPKTETDDATDISETSAVLNGTINPVGLPSTYHFEYGTTSSYGSRIPVGIDAVVGADRNDRKVGRTIVGLEPGTTYHFRLVAQNSAGVNQGVDRTFTTAGVGGIPHRAYEQVTPVDKGGIPIREGLAFQAKADGSALSYTTQAGSASAPAVSRSMSLRGGADWNGGIDLDPPFNKAESIITGATLAVSADFTHTLIATNRKLTPDAVEDGPDRLNLYLVDVRTGAHTLITTAPGGLFFNGGFIATGSSSNFFAGAADFSWVVFRSPVPLKPGVPAGALYRWSAAGGLEVVSVLPGGGAEPVTGNGGGFSFARSVSADGSRIYFSVGGSQSGLYLWEEGAPTKAISVSHVPGDPAGPHRANLIGTSEDGRYAFFFCVGGSSSPVQCKLTSDAPDVDIADGNVYRYDASDGSLEYLGATAYSQGDPNDFMSPVGVSDDGQTAYWTGGGPGAESVGTLVWRKGVLRTATTFVPLSASLSTDGRYFAYAKDGNLYLYDSEADHISCVSCLPDGTPAGGYFPFSASRDREVSNRDTQAVTDVGQVFFTSAARLAAADVNGAKDVYEYKDGQNTLITPGNAPFDASFDDISEDGSDVFFTTPQKLVGQDNDKSVDVYDARIGEGLAKQNPPPPQECLRDDCKATPNAGPELPFGGSEALSGPGNVSGEARKRCAKGTHARKVKGKTRCVKPSKAKKKAQNTKRANTNRRQGR